MFELSYQNISDEDAQSFLADYEDRKGTFERFFLSDAVYEGWSPGTADSKLDRAPGTQWRYDAPPAIVSVRPGISSVTVKLRAVA